MNKLYVESHFQMKDVRSTSIQSIGYNSQEKHLVIKHTNKPNQLYLFKNVPYDIFDKFNFADSKGQFFLKEVKGKFPFEKVVLED